LQKYEVMYQIWRWQNKALQINRDFQEQKGRWWVYAHHLLFYFYGFKTNKTDAI